MALYEVWSETGNGMWHAERWFNYGSTVDSDDTVLLPMSWARGLAKELHQRTGCCTEVRGTKAWKTVYARYGRIEESYGSIDDDMEGWR